LYMALRKEVMAPEKTTKRVQCCQELPPESQTRQMLPSDATITYGMRDTEDLSKGLLCCIIALRKEVMGRESWQGEDSAWALLELTRRRFPDRKAGLIPMSF